MTTSAKGDDTASIPDFDGDGTIGFGDFLLFAEKFGTQQDDGKYQARFDLDSDGSVGFSDFVIFAQNFGKVASPVVAIPDANLRAAIEEALGKASGAPITQAEMATLDSLEASDADISDLTGLESATNLTWLDLASNHIADISALAGLTYLTDVTLTANNISDLASLAANTGLGRGGTVDVKNNPLNAASHSTHIPALQARGVSVSFDVLVTIPDANLRAAIEAALRKATGAPITQAEMVTLDSLEASDADISDLTGLESATNLTWLDLASNNIADISALAGLTNLTDVTLTANNISDLASLAANKGLGRGGTVDVKNNPLNAASHSTHIPALQARGVSVSFDVLVTIPDANLRAAIEAALDKARDAPITQAEMATMDSLTANKRGISDLTGLEYATNLTWLDLASNNITDISVLEGLTNLTDVTLAANNISDLASLAANTGLGRGGAVDVKNNPLNAASHSTHIPALQSRGVSVSYVPSPIVTIPDANLRAAVEAALGKTSGAPITVAEMETLTWLEADFDAGISALTGLEFAANLRGLLLAYNPITDLSPLSGLTNLWRLSLSDTNIPDLSPLSGLTNLELLSVIATNTSDLSPLSDLTNLTSLRLSHNKIADVSPLSGLTNLTELNFWENQIEDISPLSGLTNLTQLGLGLNNVSDISALSGLTNLTQLGLNDNNITDISPLAGLTNLTFLNLAFNNIEEISALSGLTSLMELNLAANSITDTSPLSGLTNLRDLDLRGNPYETLPKGDFDIELVLLDDFTESEKNVLQYVARRWMAVITEDLPDYEFTQGWSGQCGDQSYVIPSGERIDDLRIYVSTFIGRGVHGRAGLHVLREETHLPVLGCMSFDLSHANLLITGLHEIGHVLGFASEVWSEFGFYQNPPNGDNHFNGPLATAAFDDAGGRDYEGAKVPLQTGESHWRLPVLDGELMAPYGGGTLSAITLQSLADLGYGVDISQADAYTLPGANAGKAVAKITAYQPSALGPVLDVTRAHPDVLRGVELYGQGRIASNLPSIVGDEGRTGRLESAERVWGRGMNSDLSHDRKMWGAAPPAFAEPKLTCGVSLTREPIYVVDQQGRIIRTIGD